jgi:negative regulator of genetic competence, sporulation and motility
MVARRMRFPRQPRMLQLLAKNSQEAEMAYERLDEALRQLKTDRERAEATENQQKKAGAEAIIRFARIKSAVIGPIFGEVVARLA